MELRSPWLGTPEAFEGNRRRSRLSSRVPLCPPRGAATAPDLKRSGVAYVGTGRARYSCIACAEHIIGNPSSDLIRPGLAVRVSGRSRPFEHLQDGWQQDAGAHSVPLSESAGDFVWLVGPDESHRPESAVSCGLVINISARKRIEVQSRRANGGTLMEKDGRGPYS
jgi:hypothetical protein